MIFTELAPVLLEKINPVYDWKSKMRIRLKKLLPVVLTITFLFNLNSVPANALENGRYDCRTGERDLTAEEYLYVNSNVVENGLMCAGDVIIPNGVISIDARANSLLKSDKLSEPE
jgi:hypothetical protein